MFVKKLSDCVEFTALDGCRLRELIHPAHDPVELPFSIAIASIGVGSRSLKHRLKATEIYYILGGRGCMHIGDESQEVEAGDGIVIPVLSVQWIENTGKEPLRFAAIVSPPWRAAMDERME